MEITAGQYEPVFDFFSFTIATMAAATMAAATIFSGLVALKLLLHIALR